MARGRGNANHHTDASLRLALKNINYSNKNRIEKYNNKKINYNNNYNNYNNYKNQLQ